jgi:hypothetical protein
MNTYNVRVQVYYDFEVEAESQEEAEKEGWNYEEYSYTGEVWNIDVELLEEGEEE